MEKCCKMRKRIWASFAGILLIISLAVFLSGKPAYGFAADGSGKTVLAFTSDIHNSEENTAANRLDNWLDKVENKCGDIDVMSFCGDMGSARAQETAFWTYTSRVMDVVENKSISDVYTTGNHEFYNGKFTETENVVRGKYQVGEVGEEGRNFIIYCLGTDNWNDHKDNYPETQIEDLAADLNSLGNDKPIIILTHFPLHTFGTGNRPRQTENADRIIDTLNDAADSGKKIVLLWGHNHTVKDTYYDQIYVPGDSIEYKSGSSKELKFYYGAAGCMSDSEYGSGSAFVKGKGLVITINDDNKLTFTYYDANANNVTEGGTYSEIPVQATDMVIDEAVDEGGETIGQTIAAGKKIQLHVYVEPENATRRGLTWSSTDENVATVSPTGLVRGVSEGKARIIATIPATAQTEELYASIEITVTPREKEPVFVLTDKLEPGKNYIIASQKTGTAYALTNVDGSAGATEVRIDGDKITSDNETIIFTTEASGETGVSFRNEENYLQVSMGSMSFEESTPDGRPWLYDADRNLTCQGSRSDYYLYFDGNNYRIGMNRLPTAGTPAGGFPTSGAAAGAMAADESVSREIYLFVETEIPDPEPEPAPEPEKKTAYITYNLGGGTYNGSSADIVETHKDGDVIRIHEAPVRDGYTFSYWKGSEYQPGDSYTVSGDHTFTAVWEANKTDADGSGSGDTGDGTKTGDSGSKPKTGDEGYMFYLVLLLGSAAVLTAMLAARMIKTEK